MSETIDPNHMTELDPTTFETEASYRFFPGHRFNDLLGRQLPYKGMVPAEREVIGEKHFRVTAWETRDGAIQTTLGRYGA